MAAKGSAVARIGLDVSAFEKGAQAVFKSVNSINNSIKTIAAVTGGAFVFGALLEGANAFKDSITGNIASTLRFSEELANLSHATGLAAGAFLTLGFAREKGISNERAAKMLGAEAKAISDNASLFRDASIKLAVVGEKMKGFWLGVTEKAAPLLDKVFDKIIEFDFVSWGERIAKPFADIGAYLFQVLSDGRLAQVLMQLGAVLAGALANAFHYVYELATTLFDHMVDRLSVRLENAFKYATSFSYIKAPMPEMPKLPKFGFDTRTLADFEKVVADWKSTLTKFDESSGVNRKDPFEFKKPYQNFGVDSLQAIGGGGGVGGGTMSLIDTANKQLDVQQGMLQALNKILASGLESIRIRGGDTKYDPFMDTNIYYDPSLTSPAFSK